MSRDPLLRALTVYGIAGLIVLLFTPLLIRALGLPSWLSTFVAFFTILAAPVVAAGAWLIDRRR